MLTASLDDFSLLGRVLGVFFPMMGDFSPTRGDELQKVLLVWKVSNFPRGIQDSLIDSM